MMFEFIAHSGPHGLSAAADALVAIGSATTRTTTAPLPVLDALRWIFIYGCALLVGGCLGAAVAWLAHQALARWTLQLGWVPLAALVFALGVHIGDRTTIAVGCGLVGVAFAGVIRAGQQHWRDLQLGGDARTLAGQRVGWLALIGRARKTRRERRGAAVWRAEAEYWQPPAGSLPEDREQW